MPTESVIPPPTPPSQSPDINYSSTHPGVLKCSLCGVSGLVSSPLHGHEGIVNLNDSIERLCGGCVRAQDIRQRMEEAVSEEGDLLALGLGLRGVRVSDGSSGSGSSPRTSLEGRSPVESAEEEPSRPTAVPAETERSPQRDATPLTPADTAQPWRYPSSTTTDTIYTETKKADDTVPIRILEVAKSRINSRGKGALHPGSTFKGTQTSGRSAYEVEVKIADVNLAESTVSGYLSIQHLTDAHPHLTTFFTGEIIGPDFGFITGSRFGASENDDMRHWGRFEQFRRPATRGDMVRPELFFRDPQPDRSRGETRAKDRDFMFLRIKERFLVPDHRVRDISGASFAGFYYAMIDFSPGLRQAEEPEPPLRSPTSPNPSHIRVNSLASTPGNTSTPMTSETGAATASTDSSTPSAPPLGRRRVSSSGGGHQASSNRRSSGDPRTGPARHAKSPGARDITSSTGEATIRGYYFHSLNQEPFQELFLSHVPTRSVSTFEMR